MDHHILALFSHESKEWVYIQGQAKLRPLGAKTSFSAVWQ